MLGSLSLPTLPSTSCVRGPDSSHVGEMLPFHSRSQLTKGLLSEQNGLERHRDCISFSPSQSLSPQKACSSWGLRSALACDGKCLFSLLQAVPSAGQCGSSRYAAQQPRASPPYLSPLHCSPCPPPASQTKGRAQRTQPRDSAPTSKLLDSCSFLTETAWVFMGSFYVKSRRISGETSACKKAKKKPQRWGSDWEGAEGKLSGRT